jgi:diadenylate cyclase
MTRVSDSLVIVVSEETGAISLGERGRLLRWLSVDALRSELRLRLAQTARDEDDEDAISRADSADAEEAA